MPTWQLVHITKPDILRPIILLLSLQAVNFYMLRERWGSKGCRCQSIQREPHILKNWLSQNAAGFVWRLRWDWTGWRRREGASAERAGTCPVLKVCHPQLEHGPSPKLTKLYSHDSERQRKAQRKTERVRERVCTVCLQKNDWLDRIRRGSLQNCLAGI